jgi:hypothetical protein
VNFYRWAYFMAGHFEDAWHVQERQPMDKLTNSGFFMEAAIPGALGRTEQAKQAVTDAVAHGPNTSIQDIVRQPGMIDEERRKLVDRLLKAGFPACAGLAVLAESKYPFPLRDCASNAAG